MECEFCKTKIPDSETTCPSCNAYIQETGDEKSELISTTRNVVVVLSIPLIASLLNSLIGDNFLLIIGITISIESIIIMAFSYAIKKHGGRKMTWFKESTI